MPPTSVPPADVRENRHVAVLIGVLGALVSLLGSWNVSLWTDEAVTISAASRDLDALWDLTGHIDAVHGAYYTLMHVWVSLFGTSPFSLRLPSAIATGATVAGTATLGCLLAGRRTGIFAGLVLIVLPRASWMGIEARSFAFGAAVAIWLTVLLVVALQSPSRARTRRWRILPWISYAALAACGIAVNLYVALVLCGHAFSVLFARRVLWTQRWAWCVSAVAGVVMASPIILFSLLQSSQIAENELTPIEWVRNIFVNQWFLGSTPTGGAVSTYPDLLWKVSSVALACVCWSVVLTGAVLLRRDQVNAGARTIIVWAGPLIVVPTLAIFAYSTLGDPMYNPRYLTFTTPGVALLIGCALALIQRHRLGVAALALIVVLALPVYFSQRTVDAKSGGDWSLVADFVDSEALPGDTVYFAPRNITESPIVEQTMRRVETAYPKAFAGLDDLTLMTRGEDDASIDGTSVQLEESLHRLDGVDRVWMVEHLTYPSAASDADKATLGTENFQPFVEWEGSLTRVTGFRR